MRKIKKSLFTILFVILACTLLAFSGGNGTEANPFHISNRAEFDEMIGYQDSLHTDCYYKFMADVDFGAIFWTNPNVELYGKVDGNGFKLKNFRIAINSNEEWVGGLFSALKENAVLKNLTVELHPDGYIVNSAVTWTGFSVICSANYGLIQNCSVIGTIYAGRGDFGSIANQNLSVIDGCSCNITVNSQAGYVGGICAYNGEGAVIKNCNAQMTTTSGSEQVGGISSYNRGLLQNCSSNSTIHGNSYVGGVCGKSVGDIKGCTSSGVISGYMRVGGLVGYVTASFNSVLIENCSSSCQVSISGDHSSGVGGLIGVSTLANSGNNTITINSCFATGNVTAPFGDPWGDPGTGGLIGRVDYGGNIYNCYATGNVTGDYACGLVSVFIGKLDGTSKMSNCYATGNVTGYIYCAGLVGIGNHTVIENCYARGNVIVNNLGVDYGHYGGFIGRNYMGKVKYCYSTGYVKNTDMTNVVGKTFIGTYETGGFYEMNNNYFDRQTADNNTQVYDGYMATGKSTSEMKQQSTFTNWSFGQNWAINSSVNNGYPYLINSGVATLPVELSAFNANAISIDNVVVEWTTQSENNLIGYHVYRSDDNVLSHTIRLTNSVIYAANSSTTQDYTFTDSEILPDQIYYYWLQSVESDGSNTYFGPVSVRTPSEDSSGNVPEITQILSVYPNPVKQNQTLHLQVDVKENDSAVIEIFNIKGQLLKTFKTCSSGSHNLVWDMKDNKGKKCATGVYFYRLSSPSVQQIHKIMILK